MEITIEDYRKGLEDFAKRSLKKSYQPYQKMALGLLKLDDNALNEWRNSTEGAKYSFAEMALIEVTEKEDQAKYKRLCAKRLSPDFEDWSEKEEDFITEYEEMHHIEDSIL